MVEPHRWGVKRPFLPLTVQVKKKWLTAPEIGLTVQQLQAMTTLNQIEFRFKPGRKGFPTTNIMQWRRKKK